jgi:hypothetical protein
LFIWTAHSSTSHGAEKQTAPASSGGTSDAASAEVVEGQVPAQAEACQREAADAPPQRVLQDRLQILDQSAVVEVRLAIRLAAGAAVVPDQHVPTRVAKRARQTAHIGTLRIAFHAEGDDEQGRSGRRPLRLRPIEVQEVAIGRVDTLAPVGRRRRGPEGPQYGLQVRIAQEEGSAVA